MDRAGGSTLNGSVWWPANMNYLGNRIASEEDAADEDLVSTLPGPAARNR